MKLNILTNSRPTQDLGAILVAGVTDGQIKVSPDFAKLIGLTDGTYMAVGEDADDRIWAFAGGDQATGNKLAKSGSYLQMSSKNVWNILKGNEDNNRIYVPEGDVVEDDEGTYVEIIFDRAEDKVARISKGEDDEGDAPADEQYEEADKEEEEV